MMTRAGVRILVAVIVWELISAHVLAQPPATAAATAALPEEPHPASFDRLTVSGDGSSLTGTHGGGGGSLGWLHNFDSDTLLGIAAEHQVLSVSHWTFGSLAASMTRGPGNQRYTLSAEAHEGAGDDGGKAFKYRVEALGLTGTYFHRLSATLEDRQINVETTHGNLPKVQLSYLWNLHVQTALSYQYSFGGNLGTHLTSGRIDLYGPVNFLGGFAVGQAAPSVLGFALTLPPHDLREGYVGLAKSLPKWRSDITFIVDYQHLSGGPTLINGAFGTVPDTTRWTGTLSYIVHLNGA
jgi:hypothetical protein